MRAGSTKQNWVVFVSGEGTNLQNFLDLEHGQLKHQTIVGVYADRPCRGIERAHASGKKTLVLSPKNDLKSEGLLRFLEEVKADRVFLLGYMRILSANFLSGFQKSIINLHPSWLPKFRGLNAIEQAVEAKEEFIGVTLHEVIEDLDAGPILRQLSFPMPRDKSLDEIKEMVHTHERRIVRDYLLDLDQELSNRAD